MDASSADSLAHLSEDDVHGSGMSAEESDVLIVARWWDVHRAAALVTGCELLERIVKLELDGFSQDAIATMLGVPRTTLRRRFKATMDEMLEVLGGVRVGQAPVNPVGTRKLVA